MSKHRIIPLSEMYSWRDVWLVFRDITGDWHDCTGSTVKETQDTLTIGNREDHRKFEIPKAYIEHLEEITDESRSRWLSNKTISNVAVKE